MSRRIVKVTLNGLDVFDSVILEYLEGKRNAAGELKKLAYNCIVLKSSTGRQPEERRSVSDADTEIDNKLNKMLEV